MNTTLTAPNFPTVERFSRLLRSGGWEHRDDDAFTSLWTKTVDSRDFQIVLPLHDGTPDARTLLAEAVDTLESPVVSPLPGERQQTAAPGGLTATSPGQTDRVARALANAARRAVTA